MWTVVTKREKATAHAYLACLFANAAASLATIAWDTKVVSAFIFADVDLKCSLLSFCKRQTVRIRQRRTVAR